MAGGILHKDVGCICSADHGRGIKASTSASDHYSSTPRNGNVVPYSFLLLCEYNSSGTNLDLSNQGHLAKSRPWHQGISKGLLLSLLSGVGLNWLRGVLQQLPFRWLKPTDTVTTLISRSTAGRSRWTMMRSLWGGLREVFPKGKYFQV